MPVEIRSDGGSSIGPQSHKPQSTTVVCRGIGTDAVSSGNERQEQEEASGGWVLGGSISRAVRADDPPALSRDGADGGRPVRTLIRQSVITCPHCRHARQETMPTHTTLFLYRCMNCGAMLRPTGDDCCVFCSYGSVKCPPIQQLQKCLVSGPAR